ALHEKAVLLAELCDGVVDHRTVGELQFHHGVGPCSGSADELGLQGAPVGRGPSAGFGAQGLNGKEEPSGEEDGEASVEVSVVHRDLERLGEYGGTPSKEV